jgi:hypothetical protein
MPKISATWKRDVGGICLGTKKKKKKKNVNKTLSQRTSQVWWFTSVTPVTQDVGSRRITV